MTKLGYNIDSKHVRLRLHKKLIPKFIKALPKGLGATIYPVPREPRKLVDENIRNVTFTATRRNPDPTCRRDMEDINNFLSKLNNIDPRIKLVADKITLKDQPNLMEKPWIKLETMLDSPKIVNDPEMEPFLRKAEKEKGNVRRVKVTESYLRDREEMYKKMKKQFIKTEFKRSDLEEDKERDPETNEKVYFIRHGEI